MYTIFAMINVIGRFARSAEMRQQDKESIRQSYVARYSFYAYTDCFKIRLIFQDLPFFMTLIKIVRKMLNLWLLCCFTCRKKFRLYVEINKMWIISNLPSSKRRPRIPCKKDSPPFHAATCETWDSPFWHISYRIRDILGRRCYVLPYEAWNLSVTIPLCGVTRLNPIIADHSKIKKRARAQLSLLI